MTTLELDAKKIEIFRLLLNVNDGKILTEIEDFLCDEKKLNSDESSCYSPDELRKVVLQSEDAIRNGQVFSTEEIRAV
jgi:hypothetical protein